MPITYATFACKAYRDWLDGVEASDPDWECPADVLVELHEPATAG